MRRSMLVLFAVALLWACTAEQREALVKITATQKILAAQYPDGTVNVNLMNDRHLVIAVLNSSFNGKPATERAAQARKSAETAFQSLGGDLDDVRVSFVSRKGIGVTITNTIDSYAFKADELKKK